MTTPPRKTPLLHLVDLSDNNKGPWDFAAMKAGGIDGVILKLSEGTGYRNERFAAAWPAIKAAGLWRAWYHYAWPNLYTAEQEADWALAQAPHMDPYDGAFLDMEEGSGDLSPWALTWWGRIGSALGVPENLYSYPDFIRQHLTDPALARMNLWLSSLGTLPTRMPPWSSIALWQYSWSASVLGVTAPVDESSLARDLAGLRALGKPAPTPPLTVVTVAGGLKQQPNNTSHLAVGPDQKGVHLVLGQIVEPYGVSGTYTNVRLPHSPVHGYYPTAHLATR